MDFCCNLFWTFVYIGQPKAFAFCVYLLYVLLVCVCVGGAFVFVEHILEKFSENFCRDESMQHNKISWLNSCFHFDFFSFFFLHIQYLVCMHVCVAEWLRY